MSYRELRCAHRMEVYRSNIRRQGAHNTLASTNPVRDWSVDVDSTQSLIGIARRLCADNSIGMDLRETVCALDATAIDLCVSVFPRSAFAGLRRPWRLRHAGLRYVNVAEEGEGNA